MSALQEELKPDHQTDMTDTLTPRQRTKTMRAVKGKDTKPELRVRRMLHALGYRYRLHRRDLPGAPDLVFPGRKKVIFVHGCFWHGHDCKHGRNRPASNRSYWTPKLDRNVARDQSNQAKLRELGWAVMVLWECELADEAALKKRVVGFLDGEEGVT